MLGSGIGGWPGCGALTGVAALPSMDSVAALRSAEHAAGRMGRIRTRATTRRVMARRPSGGCRTPREDQQRLQSRASSVNRDVAHACHASLISSSLAGLFHLASHAAHGASLHGRSQQEARPVPGQSEFAPCRRQSPIDIHSWHFWLDAGCEARAAPAQRVDQKATPPITPPNVGLRLSAGKKPSTALIQEAEVG